MIVQRTFVIRQNGFHFLLWVMKNVAAALMNYKQNQNEEQSVFLTTVWHLKCARRYKLQRIRLKPPQGTTIPTEKCLNKCRRGQF